MSDCYYHGYSGGPGGCYLCEKERAQKLEPGSLQEEKDTSANTWQAANIASIGRSLAAEMARDESKKKKK